MDQVMLLVSTLIVLVRLLQLLSPTDMYVQNLLRNTMPFVTKHGGEDGVLRALKDLPTMEHAVEKACAFVKTADDAHPMTYSTLELARSWEEFVYKVLDV